MLLMCSQVNCGANTLPQCPYTLPLVNDYCFDWKVHANFNIQTKKKHMLTFEHAH